MRNTKAPPIHPGAPGTLASGSLFSLGITNQQNATITWAGGTIQGSGTIYVSANEGLNIQGAATKVLNQTTIFNYGNAVWSGTGNIQVSNGARIIIDGNYTPSGSFDIRNDQTVQNMGGSDCYFILQNGGSLTKSAGTGLSDIQMYFQNNGGAINLMGRRVQTRQLLQNTGTLQLNGGELDVAGAFTESGGTIQIDTGTLSVTGSALESAGQLSLAGGTVIASGGMQISSGAMLSGSGMIVANVTNAGHIAVGAAGGGTMGTLIVSGNYTQQSGGYLVLDVSGSSSADHLSITGLATLNGILWINGTPSGPGASFDLLDWGSRSGTFSYVSLPSLSSGTWSYQYDVPSGHFTLKVV